MGRSGYLIRLVNLCKEDGWISMVTWDWKGRCRWRRQGQLLWQLNWMALAAVTLVGALWVFVSLSRSNRYRGRWYIHVSHSYCSTLTRSPTFIQSEHRTCIRWPHYRISPLHRQTMRRRLFRPLLQVACPHHLGRNCHHQRSSKSNQASGQFPSYPSVRPSHPVIHR